MPAAWWTGDPPIRLTRWIPGNHVPHPPQHAFLWLDQFEALYGGAAGGGKSDALLMAALQYADVPGYAALLLRKSYADLSLPGAIMDRSKEWLTGTDAHWSEIDKTWTFPSRARLTFGYLQTANDKYRYQGAEFQFVGFDELTQFAEADYLYLSSRLRRPDSGALSEVPLRLRSASNPGGKGHRWVKRRYLDKEPNPLDPDDTPEKCVARIFIPAKVADNPAIDRDAYLTSLSALDPETRQQLADGNWNARGAGLYVFDDKAIAAAVRLGRDLDAQYTAGEAPAPVGNAMGVGVDWGDFRTHAVPLWELERGGLYIPPGEIASTQQDVEDITVRILASLGSYPWWLAEERYDASFKQSNRTFARTAEARLGPHNQILRIGRPNTVPVAFGTYKSLAVSYLRLLLRRTLDGETTRVLAISPANTILLEQMLDYTQADDGKFEKGGDDAVDSLIAGVTPIARKHREAIQENLDRAKQPVPA